MNGMMKEMMTPMMHSTMNTAPQQKSNLSCETADAEIVSEKCRGSAFSLATFAGSILLCVGIIVYALLTA